MVKRQGLLSLTGIALLGLIVLMTLHEWDYALPDGRAPRDDVPSMVLEGIRAVSHQEDGTPEYRVAAASLTFYENSQRSQLTDPQIELFGRQGRWEVQAEQGQMDQVRKIIELDGNVKASRHGAQPVSLSADHLIYHADEERLQIPVPTHIMHEGGETRAGRLEANLREGLLVMQEGVETRYVPPAR